MGQIYLNARFDKRQKSELFLNAMQLNPFQQGQKIAVPFPRDKYPTEKQKKEIKSQPRGSSAASALRKSDTYGQQFTHNYFSEYPPHVYQQLSARSKQQVWHEAVAAKGKQKTWNLETGVVIKHSVKSTVTDS